MIKRVIFAAGDTFYISDTTKDYHTKYGVIKKEDINEVRGKTHMGKPFLALPAAFVDSFYNLRRDAQAITLKDAGVILAYTGIDKNSVVVDAGTGSGYLACFMARCAKKVYSFDLKESAVELGKKNAAFLELDNVEFAVGDVSQDIALPNCDVFILDMPTPQTCLNSVSKVLKSGGILTCYLPCITQVITLVSALGEGFIHFKTVEVMEREWHVHEPKVRPISDSISHTAFLVFIRKI